MWNGGFRVRIGYGVFGDGIGHKTATGMSGGHPDGFIDNSERARDGCISAMRFER